MGSDSKCWQPHKRSCKNWKPCVPCDPSEWSELSWPLQIVAGLLPAAAESHHSVALAPHILANYPLGGVAGTSPEKRHSFFQLHSVDKEKMHTKTPLTKKALTDSLDCIQLINARRTYNEFFPSVCRADGSLHCLVFKRCPSCSIRFDHTLIPKRTTGFFLKNTFFSSTVHPNRLKHSTCDFIPNPHLISSLKS